MHIGTSSCHITPSEAQALHEEINQKNATSGIRSVFAELGNVKTNCTLLASLFSEVAECLNHDVGSGRQECWGRAVARSRSAAARRARRAALCAIDTDLDRNVLAGLLPELARNVDANVGVELTGIEATCSLTRRASFTVEIGE